MKALLLSVGLFSTTIIFAAAGGGGYGIIEEMSSWIDNPAKTDELDTAYKICEKNIEYIEKLLNGDDQVNAYQGIQELQGLVVWTKQLHIAMILYSRKVRDFLERSSHLFGEEAEEVRTKFLEKLNVYGQEVQELINKCTEYKYQLIDFINNAIALETPEEKDERERKMNRIGLTLNWQDLINEDKL